MKLEVDYKSSLEKPTGFKKEQTTVVLHLWKMSGWVS